jgi:hypothetical protein
MIDECDSCHQYKELGCYNIHGEDFYYCDKCAKEFLK